MTTIELFETCRQAGVKLSADGDRLRYEAPRGALTPDLRTAIQGQKSTLLAVLWRLDAMRQHGVDRTGQNRRPPVALAKLDAKGGPGHCFSCGATHEHAEAYGRCAPCDVAADLFYAQSKAADAEEVA